jgi:hypothetical protein
MKKRISLSAIIGLVALCSSAPAQNIPGNVASAGLTTVVPDVLVWYNSGKLPGHPFNGYVTNGPVDLTSLVGNTSLGNDHWFQNVSVLGDSTFLIAANTFADDGSWDGSTNGQYGSGVFGTGETTPPTPTTLGKPNQSDIVIFQPVSGGAPRVDSSWYDDFGNPFRLHTIMRQKMQESSHVAGDKRPGGTNFMTEGIASFWYCKLWFGKDYFNTDGRFSTNLPLYATGYPSGNNQDGECVPYPGINVSAFPEGFDDLEMASVQAFSLNPGTLVPTPLSKAAVGPYRNVTNQTATCVCDNIAHSCGASATDCAITGGGTDNWLGYQGNVVALDNGNFLSVVSDPTDFFGGTNGSVGREDPVATIFAPDGSLVKDTWWVAPNGTINMNIAAYSGGFCIRSDADFFFYDDNGNLLHTNTVANSGVAFDTSRGDHTRIGSDIRSHYVYMAGLVGKGYQLGIWDARTGLFLTNVLVHSDIGPLSTTGSGDDAGGNAELGVDQLDRVCVAFEGKPTGVGSDWSDQVMARVLQWNGTNVSYLTPTFFPFVNSDNTNTVYTQNAGFAQGFNTTTPSVAMTKEYICIAAKGFVNSTNNPSATPDTDKATTLYTVITAPVSIPTAAAVGLKNIVPDMLLWYDGVNNYYTNGPVNLADVLPDSTIWEPYSCVLGDSTFVIANVTFANDYPQESGNPPQGNDDEAYVVALQPAAGGPPTLGSGYYTDYGTAYFGPISARKTGNPGRVAADKRYGAVNYLYAAQCNAGNPAWSGTNFQSNGSARWNNGPYLGGNRYAVEQTFSLNPSTLAQTPLALASDFLGDPPNSGATTFGDVLALDNGNFAIIEDDSSGVVMLNEGATYCVMAPDGTIVQPATAVNSGISTNFGLWANCAAYKGGFCVRFDASLYFYDNAGTLRGSVPQSTSGILFDTGRGDTTRIASDIRSHYVYLAGAPWPPGVTPNPNTSTSPSPTTGSPVMLAIWDADTMKFVASATVSSDIVTAPMVVNGANLAVDALDRVTVGWDCIPSPAFGKPGSVGVSYQVVARVMQFDGTNITYLTPSFFPFVNCDLTGSLTKAGLVTRTPGIAMTPRQICISCKGSVNSTNNPTAGADTPPYISSSGGLDLYTILSHPAPVVAPAPAMTATVSGSSLIVSWPAADGLFTVQTTPQVKSSGTVWTGVTAGNVAPPVTVPITAANKYVRLMRAF